MEYVSIIFSETLGCYWYHYGAACHQPCVDRSTASSAWTSRWRTLQSHESNAYCLRCILPERYPVSQMDIYYITVASSGLLRCIILSFFILFVYDYVATVLPTFILIFPSSHTYIFIFFEYRTFLDFILISISFVYLRILVWNINIKM
jgi:hypothetical protein